MSNANDRRWYIYSQGEAHTPVKDTVDSLLTTERRRIRTMLDIQRIYRSRASTTGTSASNVYLDTKTSRNTMRSVAKTVHSRLISLKPIPFFCSDGGDTELRERLELLNTAVHGLFLSSGFEAKHASSWCLHGILYGTGFLKVYNDNGKVCIDRVYPWEVLVDPLDGLYGDPQNIYQVRWVDKPVLMAAYPKKKKDAIERCVGERPDWAYWLEGVGSPVRVTEAWHLPDSNGKGGRHVICTSAGTLLDEEYTYDSFPLVAFHYADPEDGFWPDGVGHTLYARQREINTISAAVKDTIRRLAWPKVFVMNGSQVNEGELDNTIGGIVHYDGKPPVIGSPPPLAREAVQYLSDVVASCFEDEGVSQFSAQAQRTPGLTSGRALRINADQMDGRQRESSEKWTQARTRLGEALIRVQREASKVDPKSPVIFTNAKKRETVSVVWADVDIEDSILQLVEQPVSSLPWTAASRAALLEELYNSGSGVITLDEYREGIDLPDIAALTDDAKAPRRAISKILDGIVQTGVYAPPEPFFDMAEARLMGLRRYCREYVNETAEPIMALLRRWCMDCKDQQNRMIAQQQAAVEMQKQALMAQQQQAAAVPVVPEDQMPVEGLNPGGK